jgi:hypothetical protein
MIDRILDKYFAKKYKKIILDVSMYYFVDLKFKRKNRTTKVYIKKKKYKDYRYLLDFYDGESIYRLINYEESRNRIDKCIKTYLEMEKNYG